MARQTSGYTVKLLLVVGLLVGLFLADERLGRAAGPAFILWTLAAFAAEALQNPSADRRTAISVAAGIQIPVLAVTPSAWGVLAVPVAGYLGARFWRRTPIRVAVAYGLRLLGASLAATAVFAFRPRPGDLMTWQTPILVAVGGVVFQLVSRGLIVLHRRRRRRPTDEVEPFTWAAVLGSGNDLITGGALVLTAILGVLCYEALGFRGVLLCAMPILYVRDASRRFLDLQAAQARIVEMERLVAKGEMAAEIGHELNNYLSAVSGRAQLLTMSAQAADDEASLDLADRLRDVSVKMAVLARGLMDFSHRHTMRTRVELGELVTRTVELVKPHARFRGVTFDVSAMPALPQVEMDPGQIQQVILTLLRKAAGPASTEERALHIATRGDPAGRTVALEIRGGAASTIPAPGAETPEDPEFGTVVRIMDRHHGRFEAALPDEGLEGFRIVLPAA